MNISFTNKILFGFIVISFLGILGHVFMIVMSGRVERASSDILDIQKAAFLVSKMDETAKLEGKLARRYGERPDTAQYGEFAFAAASFNTLVEDFRFQTFWADAEIRAGFNRVVAQHNGFLARFNLGVHRPGSFQDREFRLEMEDNLDGVSQSFLPMHIVLQQRIESKITLLESAIARMNRMVLFLLVLTSVVAVGLCFFITRSILVPFRKLLLYARQIGEGQFDSSLDAGNADLEVRELMEAFGQMALKLKKYRDNLIQTERFNAISSIATSVSHEVNNPLMIISGNAEWVRTVKAGGDQETREKMGAIIKEVERISDITKKLSHIKKIILEDYALSEADNMGQGKLIDIAGSARGEGK